MANFILDDWTLIFTQVAVSTALFLAMLDVWYRQKTYPGFGRWTISKLPNALGFLLIALRGFVPEWASVILANVLLFTSPLLIFEGIRQFRGRPHRDWFNYALMVLLTGAFAFFYWVKPNINVRVMAITVCTAIVIARCAWELLCCAPREWRYSFWFNGLVFGAYAVVMFLRVGTAIAAREFANPFDADRWQEFMFLATIVLPIAWTFGFFMMTNARLMQELRESEQNLALILDNVNAHIFIVDSNSRYLYANRQMSDDFGVPRDKMIGQDLGQFVENGRDLDIILDNDRRVIAGETIRAEETTTLNDTGKRQTYWTVKLPLRREDGAIYAVCGISTDISELKAVQEELRELSLKDELTDLYNRRGFNLLAEQQLKTTERLNQSAVLFYGDMDGLKTINDRLGHQEGDNALRDTALILKATFRASDIVARIGGDEFIALAMESAENSGEQILARLHQAIDEHNQSADRPYVLSISFGMARYNMDSRCTLDELLENADKAMYAAKAET